jgi:hypothetical protein
VKESSEAWSTIIDRIALLLAPLNLMVALDDTAHGQATARRYSLQLHYFAARSNGSQWMDHR